ncbi:MAG: element excision factor XisH family protein [Oscillatoria sp. PMC 1068.18]|nr:element excision factor XisH family protein [Oscillatoria sp. PMC 1076.18]MEC4987589.1 element excision factor XisH family protein [Oscillatoria sp. PMC 1068.18]
MLSIPAKDIYHDPVKKALIKDNWVITDDPLTLTMGKKRFICRFRSRKNSCC